MLKALSLSLSRACLLGLAKSGFSLLKAPSPAAADAVARCCCAPGGRGAIEEPLLGKAACTTAHSGAFVAEARRRSTRNRAANASTANTAISAPTVPAPTAGLVATAPVIMSVPLFSGRARVALELDVVESEEVDVLLAVVVPVAVPDGVCEDVPVVDAVREAVAVPLEVTVPDAVPVGVFEGVPVGEAVKEAVSELVEVAVPVAVLGGV